MGRLEELRELLLSPSSAAALPNDEWARLAGEYIELSQGNRYFRIPREGDEEPRPAEPPAPRGKYFRVNEAPTAGPGSYGQWPDVEEQPAKKKGAFFVIPGSDEEETE